MRWSVPSVLLVAACSGDLGTDTSAPRDLQLSFTLDAATASAGDRVGLSVTLSDDQGTVEPDGWSITSDVEPGIATSGDGIKPKVAGEHIVSLTARSGPNTFTGSAVLDVSPGPVDALDLTLSAEELRAGDVVTYAVSVVDAYGNPVTDAAPLVSSSFDALSLGPGTVTSTQPGWYALSAALDGVTDTEALRVRPGPADAITLDVWPLPAKLGDTVVAEVALADTYGNDTTDAWTLSTDRPSDASVSARHVTFEQEGWFTLTAAVDETGLSASVGPILVDGTGPALDITAPARGTLTDGLDVLVQGTVSDTWWDQVSLDIGGTSVPVGADGVFSQQWLLDYGMTVIETTAADGYGNATGDKRAVLSGAFLPPGDQVTDGIEVRIEQGPGGFDTLEALATGLVDGTDLGALVPSPVYENVSESCIDPCGWFGSCEYCFTWYSVHLYVNNPRLGATSLDIDPQANGTVALRFSANDPALDWSANGVVAELGYSGVGDISASRIDVTVVVRPAVRGGQLALDFVSATARTHGFQFNMDGWLVDVLNFFGVPVSSWVEGYMTDAIEGAVVDTVGPFVADALNQLALSYAVPIGAGEVTVDAVPTGVAVDDLGLSLTLGTQVGASGVRAMPGSFYGGYSIPNWTGAQPAGVAMSVDFVNQLLAGAWAAGAMDQELDLAALGFGDLSLVLPGVTDARVLLRPALPPILVPEGPVDTRLQIGDLRVEVYDGPPADANLALAVYVSVDAIADISFDGALLYTDISGARSWFDVVYPETGTLSAARTEQALSALVPFLLPYATDVVQGIELPTLSGFTLSDLDLRREEGVLILDGALQ